MAFFANKRSLITGIVVFLLIVGVSAVFVVQMNQLIESSMMNTIGELAEHDLVSIDNFLERNWKDLGGIYSRMVAYNCQTILELQERLNLERSTGDFYTLYLVDEEGNVYSDRYHISSKEELNIYQYLEGAEDPIAVRYDYRMATESWKEMVLYAIPLEDYQVEGVRFIAIAGISNISQIQDRLALYSFYKNGESRGYSSVVNLDGDYIVNIRRTISLNQRENLFEILDSSTTPPAWDNSAVEAHMKDSDTFHFYYLDTKGVEKLLYFVPIEGVNWYLILMVERAVFSDLSRSFIFTSLIMVIFTIVISSSAMLLVVKTQKSVLAANAKATARTEFLSNMSHEIRTPLNGILGSLRLIRTHLNDSDITQAFNWLDKADSTARYLLSLINDFLDMSKLQDGKLELIMSPFSLDGLLDSIQTIQQSNVENKNLTLIVEKDLLAPCVIGDETRLKQVLINIVSNAVKFTPSGGTIRLSVSQEPADSGRVRTTIRCADTGIGMSPQFVERIWDSFSQEHNQESDGTKGTGLGMAISKNIIDTMQGDLSVSSEQGKGSTFTIVLLLETADPSGLPAVQAAPADGLGSSASGKPLKLLIAEDNQLNAEILIEILEGEGLSVVHAENGQIALDQFAQSEIGEFDAILMDMQMPVMDGCQATQKIRSLKRQDSKTVCIFACTANAFQEDRDKALNSGMNDFLTKPIDVGTLLSKLASQLSRKVGME